VFAVMTPKMTAEHIVEVCHCREGSLAVWLTKFLASTSAEGPVIPWECL
jgi:hypothetical protein